jgi:hypothetical protein
VVGAITADERHEAARRAVDAWIARGDDKAGGQLRDCLHALSVVATGKRHLREKVLPARRERKA